MAVDRWVSRDKQCTILFQDAYDFPGSMPADLPESTFDAIITDPPYGIPAKAGFVRKGGTVISNGVGTFNSSENPYRWIPLYAPLVKQGGHMAFFIDLFTGEAALEAVRFAGLSFWHKYYIVKAAPPPTPRPTFASSVEECIIAESKNGNRHWFGGGYTPNRWIGCTPNMLGVGLGHESEKPLEAIMELVKALTPVGGSVLDPFVGSGTTVTACMAIGRKCVAIENDRRYFEMAVERAKSGDFSTDQSTVTGIFGGQKE